MFVLAGTEPFEKKELFKCIAPITYSRWWFASTYFVLYLLSPYLNSLLKALDKKRYTAFLALLFFCWCVIPTLTEQTYQSNSLLWFVFVYSLAGYLRIYGVKTSLSALKLLLISFGCTLLTFGSAVCFDILGTKHPFFSEHATTFYGMQQLPILAISVLMFVGFSKLDLRYSKVINTVSSATFGVYLIHDHAYVRRFLWKTLFQNKAYSDSRWLIPYSLMAIGAVFAVCTVIELMRIYLLERNYMGLVNKAAAFIDDKAAGISEKILRLRDKPENRETAHDR